MSTQANVPTFTRLPTWIDGSEMKQFVPLAVYDHLARASFPYYEVAIAMEAARLLADKVREYMQGQPDFQTGRSHPSFSIAQSCSGFGSRKVLNVKHTIVLSCPHQRNSVHTITNEVTVWHPELDKYELRRNREEWLTKAQEHAYQIPKDEPPAVKLYKLPAEVRERIARG